MHTLPLTACVLLALCGAAGADTPAPAPRAPSAPRFTLLTRTQPPLPISLLGIAADSAGAPATITYLDPGAKQQTITLSEIIALAPPSWVPTPETTAPTTDEFSSSDVPIHRLDLTDGQRFVGALSRVQAPQTSSADAPVTFEHDKIGVVSVPLDRVQRYAFDAAHPPRLDAAPLSTVNDTLLLANADRLEGLVTRLGPVISVETRPAPSAPKSGAAARSAVTTTIDSRQVLLAQLVNPPVPLRSLRVDLSDGSVLAADRLSVETQTGKMSLRALASGPKAGVVTMDIGNLAAVVPDASRLIPLCTLPIAAQSPAPGRVSTAPAQVLTDSGAPLSAADILLPGPMIVEWTIPAGVSSLIGYAQMDDRSFAWGDCDVRVTIGGSSANSPQREIARGRLNAETPSLTISSALGALRPGDRLRVQVDPGQRGPIQDRVVLRRMVLLAAPTAN